MARERSCSSRAILLSIALGVALGAQDPFKQDTSPEERAKRCEHEDLQPLYENIHKDLELWRAAGISLELMQATIASHTGPNNTWTHKAFLAGFRKGVAVLPNKPEEEGLRRHASVHLTYMHVLSDLEQLFGPLIPDLDIIISTSEVPLAPTPTDATESPPPVLRSGKSPFHPDILIPHHHFYSPTQNLDLTDKVEQINAEYPWILRKPVLFGRFTPFKRYGQVRDPYTRRLGVNSSIICGPASDVYGSGMSCRVREHFINWVHEHKPHIDVGSAPKLPWLKHAGFKYLVHLDGQGLSARLDQMLALGSLVLKEESGYHAFYHHLLKPYEHYIPFWQKTPNDVLMILEWARKNDPQAQQIGEAGQQFVKTHLSREARACYWFTLLKEYASLLKYKPSEVADKPYRQYNKPVSQHLKERAATTEVEFRT